MVKNIIFKKGWTHSEDQTHVYGYFGPVLPLFIVRSAKNLANCLFGQHKAICEELYNVRSAQWYSGVPSPQAWPRYFVLIGLD